MYGIHSEETTISAVHEKRKPYKCSICEKAFCHEYSLKQHNFDVHERKKTQMSERHYNEAPNQSPKSPAATIIDPATPVKTQPNEENLFKYDVQVIGDFKLKINLTRTHTPRTLTPIQPVQRISWRASMQLGITPENLLQLQMRSPSPTKNFAPTPIRTTMSNQNKEYVKSANKFSPLSSTSLHNLTTSPILNMPVNKRRRQPSKDSPSHPKRRRVSKKLYD